MLKRNPALVVLRRFIGGPASSLSSFGRATILALIVMQLGAPLLSAVEAAPVKAAATKAPAGVKTSQAADKSSGKAQGEAGEVVADPFAQKPGDPAMKDRPPQPVQSFEDLLKDAIPATDLATMLEPLYGHCDAKADVPRRQCEGVRGFLLEHLRRHTFVAVSDSVPDTTPYDASAKEIDMEVSGCLACVSPPVVAGEVRYVSTRPPQRVVAGRAIGVLLDSHQLPMDTKVRADRFLERVVPRLRVQHVFRVGTPFGEETSGPAGGTYKGVSIVSVAHRVYDRCTGQVIASAPASVAAVKVAPDKSCPKKGDEELSQAEMVVASQNALLPEHLTSKQVEGSLAPVQDKIHDCYVEFEELGGTVRVQLALNGEGKFTQIILAPPFDKAAIGLCIKSQIKTASFPRFRGEPMKIDYAFRVN